MHISIHSYMHTFMHMLCSHAHIFTHTCAHTHTRLHILVLAHTFARTLVLTRTLRLTHTSPGQLSSLRVSVVEPPKCPGLGKTGKWGQAVQVTGLRLPRGAPVLAWL